MRRATSWFWLLALLSAAIFSLSSSTVLAGNFQWTPGNGLEGGAVRALAYDPTTGFFYAGTYGGGAVTNFFPPFFPWSQPAIPTGSPFVNAISILPPGTPFSTAFACTEGGVFYSTLNPDGFIEWLPLTNLPGSINSRTTGIIFDAFLTGDFFVATNGGGVWRGHFNVVTGFYDWTQEIGGLTATGSKNVSAIVDDGAGTLYIATNNGVYSAPTTPFPTPLTWTLDSAGPAPIGGLASKTVKALITDGVNLYAGTDGAGFFFSPLAVPLSWTQANGVFPTNLTGLSVRALTAGGGGFFAATNAGAFFTAAPGVWTNLNGSLLNDPTVGDTNLFAVALDGFGIPYVGSGKGVFENTGGTTWVTFNTGLNLTPYIYAFAFNAKDPSIVYTATNSGVYKSEDYGNNWRGMFNGMDDKNVTALAISNLNPNNLYAGTLDGSIYKSSDGGNSWQFVKSIGGRVFDIKFSPFSATDVWIGGYPGLFHSVSGGLPIGPLVGKDDTGTDLLFGATVYSIAIDPSSFFTSGSSILPTTIYVGTNNGGNPAIKSTNGGFKWKNCGTPTTKAHNFATQVLVDPIRTSRIYVISPNEVDVGGNITFGGLNISENQGDAFFTPVGLDNDAHVTFNFLSIDPIFNNRVYVANSELPEIKTFAFTAGTPPPGPLNDMTVTGPFTGNYDADITVEIDNIGAPDTFKWTITKTFGGTGTLTAAAVPIIAGPMPLSDGISVTFANTTGHAKGDKWTFKVETARLPVLFTTASFGNLFQFDDTGLTGDVRFLVLAVNPQYPNILLGGTEALGVFEYESSATLPESVTINNGADFTKSASVSLKLAYRPTTVSRRFSNDNVTWSLWSTIGPTATWTLSSGSGLKTVYVQFKDKAGFVTSASDNIILDNAKPLAGSLVVPTPIFGAATTVTINALDNVGGTGIKEFRLSNSTIFGVDPNNPVYSDWFPVALLPGGVLPAVIPWNLKIGGGTSLKVYGQFRDFAGNVLPVTSNTINDGITPPTFLTATLTGIPFVVNLNWDDNADNEKSYVIERQKLPSTTFTTIKTLNSPTIGSVNNSYTDSIASGAGTYVYRIRVTGNGINIIGPTSAPVIVP